MIGMHFGDADIERVIVELTRLQAEITVPLPILDTPEEYEPHMIRRKVIKERIRELRKVVDAYVDANKKGGTCK